jgi:23S rRNA (uracil1939-C5)-methyltransferase
LKNGIPTGDESRIAACVEDLSHDGNGVVKVDSRVYFIAGVLPGEQIEFLPRKKRRGKYQGIVLSVVEPSSHRVEPECEYFGVCGGCVLQHLDPEAQLKNKESTLLENLKRIGKVQPDNVIPPVQGSIWHYRRKARLGVKLVPKKGGILVGFRERSSSYITSIDQCKTLDRRISALLPGLHQLISKLSNNHRIPQVEVAAGDNQVALVLRHMESFHDRDISLLSAFAKEFGITQYLQPGGLDSIAALWPESPGLLSYQLPNFNLTLEFSPTDFTQVNAEVNRRMVDQVVRYLAPQCGDNILDMFCGLGNFTLALGRSEAFVIGLEGDDALVRRGQENARLNNIENVVFHKADLHIENPGESLDYLSNDRHFNKILLDPPRSGAFDVVSNLVPRIQPELVVYISCNPATLARDSNVMVNDNGYRLKHAGAIDMFPHTAHVESMAVFTK